MKCGKSTLMIFTSLCKQGQQAGRQYHSPPPLGYIRNMLAEWINERIVLRINQLVLEETVGSIFLKLTPSLTHPDFSVGLRCALYTSRSVRIVTHINNEISSSHIKNVKRNCLILIIHLSEPLYPKYYLV